MPNTPDELAEFFITTVIIMVIVGICFTVWRSLKDKKNKTRCPSCNKPWAAQKLYDELIGIFKKGEEVGDWENPQYRMALYEKYRIHIQCKYCGHKWISFESRKQ